MGSDLDLDLDSISCISSLQWNDKRIEYASEIDLPYFIDEEDQEDLEWCGVVDRSTVAVKSCRSAANLRPRTRPVIDAAGKVTLETAPNLAEALLNSLSVQKQTGCKQPEIKQAAGQSEPVETRNSRIPEISTVQTQTSPADFRMAKITFPLIDDFKAIHNSQSGHHGLDFSYRKLLKRCGSKWANERGAATKVKEQLKQFIDGCPTCQKLRGLREKIKCKQSFIISRPFLEISYDFIIFKRPDKNGNRYLLVAIDNFMKLVEMKPVQHRDAETVAQFLLEIAARYGHCVRLRSDREGAFMGQIVARLNENRGTETTPCVPYRPEANSICERQNAIVMFHLTALVLECNLGPTNKVGWSDLLPQVFSIINNTPKNPLGIAPLSMVYGVFANYDRPLLNPAAANPEGEKSNPVDYVDSLMEWQNKLLELTEDIQSRHFQKMEKRFNSKSRSREFNVGDFVLQQKDATPISGKPSCRWIGPFLVMEMRNNDPSHPVLDLMNLTDMRVKEAAADDCRLFNTSWFDEETMIPELTKIAAADLDEYVVEKIIGHRPIGETRTTQLSKYYFLVKWKDFDETTWEPYSGVKNLEPLDEYNEAHPGLKIPKSLSE